MEIQVPTKLIIVGEHLVLCGYSALAVPLPSFSLELKVDLLEQANVQLENFEISVPLFPNLSGLEDWLPMMRSDADFVKAKFGLKGENFNYKVVMRMPPGSGGGTSAAWSVALVKSLVKFAKVNYSEHELLKIVADLEDSHHGGKASGIDHLTIWRDSPSLLLNGELQLLEFDFFSYPFWNDSRLIFTGLPRETTAEMRKIVKENIQNAPEALANFKDQANLLLDAIAQNNKPKIKEIINSYGIILENVGAVSDRVKAAADELRNQKLAAKVCGAGGATDGSGLLLVYGDINNIKFDEWLLKYGFIDLTNSK